MTRAFWLFLIFGLAVIAVTHLGLGALGVGKPLLNMIGIIEMIGLCYYVNPVIDHFDRERSRH